MHDVEVYKFGGSATLDPESMEQVLEIIKRQKRPGLKLLLVFSASGKSTKKLDRIHECLYDVNRSEAQGLLEEVKNYHEEILRKFLPKGSPLSMSNKFTKRYSEFLEKCFDKKRDKKYSFSAKKSKRFNENRDEVLSFGELMTTDMVSTVFKKEKIGHLLLDSRDIVVTDNNFGKAVCDEVQTGQRLVHAINNAFRAVDIVVLQGFIGSYLTSRLTQRGRSTVVKQVTTMDFDSSDYSAMSFGQILDVDSVTLWKDVPGICKGDPETCDEYYSELGFVDAFAVAIAENSGKTPIHLKALGALAKSRVGMPLNIKSFKEPWKDGTVIVNEESSRGDFIQRVKLMPTSAEYINMEINSKEK